MDNIIIAIDGHSSTGKSTMARQLAKALGYIYVDTGAMYRAVTLYALQKGYISSKREDFDSLVNDLDNIDLIFKHNNRSGYSEMYLNGLNVEKEIRSPEVSNYVSPVAEIKEVREKLVHLQQEMGKNKGLVMDGRDIGTVVFPEADLKIFMTASPEIRANRRYQELIGRGVDINYEAVLRNVEQRDYIDSHREYSPLIKAKDAILLDNSNMSPEEQFQKVLMLANERRNKA